MSNQVISRENVENQVSVTVQRLQDTFSSFISSGDNCRLKKAKLLSYWLDTYFDYVQKEAEFDPSTLPRYERGNIISVNFGFNVGAELGGLHYAVVINNFSERQSPILNVIPLVSGTKEKTYYRDVFLGNELYEKLTARYDDEMQHLQETLNSYKVTLSILNDIADRQNKMIELNDGTKISAEEYFRKVSAMNFEALRKLKFLQGPQKRAIDKLKEGSIALMGQISTISKMRIYTPKSQRDLMYNMKLSDGAMDKINDKLRELYVR